MSGLDFGAMLAKLNAQLHEGVTAQGRPWAERRPKKTEARTRVHARRKAQRQRQKAARRRNRA